MTYDELLTVDNALEDALHFLENSFSEEWIDEKVSKAIEIVNKEILARKEKGEK